MEVRCLGDWCVLPGELSCWLCLARLSARMLGLIPVQDGVRPADDGEPACASRNTSDSPSASPCQPAQKATKQLHIVTPYELPVCVGAKRMEGAAYRALKDGKACRVL